MGTTKATPWVSLKALSFKGASNVNLGTYFLVALHKDFRSWASFISKVLVVESISQCHYKANMLTFQTNLLPNQTREGYWGPRAAAGSRVPDHSRQKFHLLQEEDPVWLQWL